MKQLFLFLFVTILALSVNAQSATATLDETGTTVTGGDGTGSIASVSWTVQGTPPAPVTFTTPNAIKTDITVTKAGNYSILFTVKDNLGNVATTTWTITAYDKQVINIDASKSHIIKLTLK